MPSESLKKKIDDLWIDTADVKPENYDFGQGYAEKWDIAVSRTEEEEENQEFIPMMNYRYPLPGFNDKYASEHQLSTIHTDEEIKRALNRAGAVTLIEDLESNEKYLALTGGGMDFSWDIVKGYVNLGFAPPAHFCRDLPSFAGEKLTEENKEAILACRKSLNAQSAWNQSGLEKLDRLESQMRANLKEYRAEKKLRK